MALSRLSRTHIWNACVAAFYTLPLLVGLEWSGPAKAQASDPFSIVVPVNKDGDRESGLFKNAKNREAVRDQNDKLAGGQITKFYDVTFDKTTALVPAELGRLFGYRYQIIGQTPGKPILLTFITRFPKPGIRPPGLGDGPPIVVNKYKSPRTVGNVFYRVYGLDAPWELVPGVWTLEIWSGDEQKEFIERKFLVY